MTKAYAVMWLTADPSDGSWITNTLVYRAPSGKTVRTYYEGHLDGRAGDEREFPRFDDLVGAMDFMTKNVGAKALVEVSVAKLIRTDKYADPV